MSRGYLPVALALWGLLFACGGDGGAPLGVVIEDREQLLLAGQVSRVQISLHSGRRACEAVRFSGARIPGIYDRELEVDPAADNGDSDFENLVPGRYTVAVWGFGGVGDDALAFGCTADVSVDIGEWSEASVTLSSL